MKKILGLDLGTTSIGWALVNEAENKDEKSSIVRLGVRVIPLTVDEQQNYDQGKSITTNADRTLKRSMRRNLQRYHLRREHLIKLLKQNHIIDGDAILYESGNNTTFQTLHHRAKAVTEEVSLTEFARILLMINKKRGYKSNRKFKSAEEDGQVIDSISIAEQLYNENLTPGQFCSNLLEHNKSNLPDFYRSDLTVEFTKIWNFQKTFYPDILTDDLFQSLQDKNKKQTWAICQQPFGLVGIKRETKGKELLKENYSWRSDALEHKLDLERLAIVLQEINGQIKGSSGYLGNISDRSKELHINNKTVGQYLVDKLKENPNGSLKNLVFYRQDYLDEFERLWTTQAQYHKELTDELKNEVRDTVIFYQRRLKSQKGLISFCEFESHDVKMTVDNKEKVITIGPRVCPKSSPLFQQFRIWQNLNNLTINDNSITIDQKLCLAEELEYKSELKPAEVFRRLGFNARTSRMNFEKLEGDRTMSAILEAYRKIILASGHGDFDFSKLSSAEIKNTLSEIFECLGWNTDIIGIESNVAPSDIESQPYYMLWHMLYSYEGDNSKSGNDKLSQKITEKYGMEKEYADVVANVTFEPDYGNLSSKAIKKILPFLKQGYVYSDACAMAGYRHSASSLTREEIESRTLKSKLDSLPKNSLRNPVVEKILNQMINVVNSIIDEYGRPDEIRVEMARELKKSQKERESATSSIRLSKKENDEICSILKEQYGFANPSRNDIIRYKLYCELAENGYRTLYSNTKINQDDIFSKKYDIEHIIPQSRFFDDSFSNKTLELRDINIEKGNKTAFDYVSEKWPERLDDYKERIKALASSSAISRTKMNHLLWKESDIPDDFLQRDLRDSQYIAKKATEMLSEVVKSVVTTTGSVTARLREDWQLVNVMQELNWDKYNRLGRAHVVERHEGHEVRQIDDWTKRNDHRHHAMDALTIAFTKRAFVQYLNNLNARIPKDEWHGSVDLTCYNLRDIPQSQRTDAVMAIEYNMLRRDSKGRMRFLPPMPLDEFRAEAMQHLDGILVSMKAKNKVATRNVNISKAKGKDHHKIQLTPRGRLHEETIYGMSHQYVQSIIKIGTKTTAEVIAKVAKKVYREALMKRLEEFGGNPKLAFGGKNSLEKNPVYLDEMHVESVPTQVKAIELLPVYTIRKPISKDIKVDKVINQKVRKILEERLAAFGGNAEKAFTGLDENPIWLNKEKNIDIKTVTLRADVTPFPLRDKRDQSGKIIFDDNGMASPNAYVKPGSNHHIAIYEDANGDLQEQVVSFMEVAARKNLESPIIDKEYNKDQGWKFLFTMKQNEMFVFPDLENGFNPSEIDLTDEANYSLISPHLFRVQKLSSKFYCFRHHLDTTVDADDVLKDITWKRIRTPNALRNIVKVRVNHLGQIVSVGEY